MEWLLGQGYSTLCCGTDGHTRQQRVVSPPGNSETSPASTPYRNVTFVDPRGPPGTPTLATHHRSFSVNGTTRRGVAPDFGSMPSPLKLESLPISMDSPVTTVEKTTQERRTVHPEVLALTRSHVLDGIATDQIGIFWELMKKRQVATGEVLAKVDDLGDSFFLVLSGQVSVSADNVQSVVLQEGDFYGESAFCALVVWGWERRTGKQPGIPDYAFRKSTCRAIQPSEVLEITARTVLDQPSTHPSITSNIVAIASDLERRWGRPPQMTSRPTGF